MSPSDSLDRTGKRVSGTARAHPGETSADAILGVFQELRLDDPEVRELMKRLAEGWGSDEAPSAQRVVIRGDTAADD